MTPIPVLTETAASTGLTALVQALVASHRLNDLADAEFRPYEDTCGFSGFGVIKVKDSVLVFSPHGVYTDIESAISLFTQSALTKQSRASIQDYEWARIPR